MKIAFLSLLATCGLLMLGTSSNGNSPDEVNADREAIVGFRLSPKEAAELEAAVAMNADDLSSRMKLLGYYLTARFTDEDAKSARKKHVLWFIENHPEAAIAGKPFCSLDAILESDGYREAKELWLKQTQAHAKNPAVLGNAASFFLLHDRDVAEQLLVQAEQLEPKNAQWPDSLGHLYNLGRTKEGAMKALAEWEKAQALDPSKDSKFQRLDSLAKAAFAAGDMEKAKGYAEELLKTVKESPPDRKYGNAVHHGNNVLGRIALKEGDKKAAAEYLLKAGETPGSPQLNSFGPNMSLAKDLLAVGEKDAVIQYFDSCRKFWARGGDDLDQWTADAKAGKAPQFGANLYY